MQNRRASTRKRLLISTQRIGVKLAECDFFLEHMKKSRESQEFGYFLSAFLSALKTFTVLGLIRKHSKNSGHVLLQLRKNSADLDLLLDFRDVEVHGEGVRIWLYRPSRFPNMSPRFQGSLWGNLWLITRKQTVRGTSRYRPRYGEGLRVALEQTTRAGTLADDPRHSFIFQDSGRDVLKSCRSALDAVRSLGD